MATTKYLELCESLGKARQSFAEYRAKCVFFAGFFARSLAEYAGWPRDLITYLPGGRPAAGATTNAVEDAMYLDEDTYWHFGLRVSLKDDKFQDALELDVSFKLLESRYVVRLFGHEDFEVQEKDLSVEGLKPIFDEILGSIQRHYADGLRLFLDNRGGNLHLRFTAQRQREIAGIVERQD